jgi:uncharacterized repeat protein (TIGR03803 family)
MEDSMTKVNGLKMGCALLAVCIATIPGRAQVFKTLITFDGTNGANPVGALVQGADGNLYGTASAGGANSDGTVFKITPDGTLTTLHSFDGTDGAAPDGALVQAADGDFYGTTRWGGTIANCGQINGCGTVFKITPHGTLTTLHSFSGPPTEGSQPIGGLVQGGDGNFYGTTAYGGAGHCVDDLNGDGCGSVFKITTDGSLTILHNFTTSGGAYPWAPLIRGIDGNFYGTTSVSSGQYDNGGGTVYRITKAGTLTTLYTFCAQKHCADGQNPYGWLVQDADGNFYGTTYAGGYGAECPYYSRNCGAVFKLSTKGKETVLYRFCSRENCADGAYPFAGLTLDASGSLYGTTLFGGAHCEGGNDFGCGTAFKLTTKGEETVLHSFCAQKGCADGKVPYGSMKDTNGKLYGTTYTGGDACSPSGCGTLFSLRLRASSSAAF